MAKPLSSLNAILISKAQQQRGQREIDIVHVISLIDSCSKRTHLLQIHAWIVSSSLLSDSAVSLAFIYRSSALRGPSYSRKFLDQIARPCRVHYNAIIRAYSTTDSAHEGLRLYRDMRRRGVPANAFSSLFAAKCCVGESSLTGGVQLHARVVRDGHGSDSHLLTSLTQMYSRSERFADARNVFDEIPERDTVAWNVLISCYLRNDRARDALAMFEAMWRGEDACEPDEVSCLLGLQACSELNALEIGGKIHRYIERRGLGGLTNLNNTLVTMYSRCGNLDRAISVFRGTQRKNVASWTALISGLAVNGRGREAVRAFLEMEKAGVSPNEQTFSAVLSACSRTGLVDEATSFFNRMYTEFGVSRSFRHYGIMVDMLGRAGLLDEAHRLITSMEIDPDPHMWRTLLGACRLHGRVDLAELAVARLVEIEAQEAGDYVLLSHTYSLNGDWDKMRETRNLVKENAIQTIRGRSTIEVDGEVHEFTVADSRHPRAREIYRMLGEIIRNLKRFGGYVVDVSSELHNCATDKERERSLSHHSEKLAMAFGVLSARPGTTIRVTKNLRTCVDCHNYAKVFSRVYGREVVFRDRNRIHHFREGQCSCNDYW